MTPEERNAREQRAIRAFPIEKIKAIVEQLGGTLSSADVERLLGLHVSDLLKLEADVKSAQTISAALGLIEECISKCAKDRPKN